MTRILFIFQHLNRGGTEAFMMSVYRGLDRARYAVDFLIYTQQESDYTKEVEASGSKVYRVTSRKQSFLKWHQELDSFFKEHAGEYQAVHFCGNSLTSIAPLRYAYKYGVPIRIAHAHSSSCTGLHNQLLHKLHRRLVPRLATHYLACSAQAACWFYESRPAMVIPNSIDVEHFKYNAQVRAEVRAELGLLPDVFVMGHVGRFTIEKNHSFALDVFAAYQREHPHSSMILVGDGPLMDEAKQKAASLGLDENVRFLGLRSDVNRIMQAMDLFIMPSTFEGLPYVLVEAQAAGLPCLLSDVITKDIAITPPVAFASIDEAPEVWATEAERLTKNFVRIDTSHIVADAGYSLSNTLRLLEGIYAGTNV